MLPLMLIESSALSETGSCFVPVSEAQSQYYNKLCLFHVSINQSIMLLSKSVSKSTLFGPLFVTVVHQPKAGQTGLYFNKPTVMVHLTAGNRTTRIMGAVAGDGEKGLGFEE